MAENRKIYKGNDKVVFLAVVGKDRTGNLIDVTIASAMRIDLIKPDGTVAQLTGTSYPTDSNIIKCVSSSIDLNQSGQYYGNPYLAFSGGFSGYGESFSFMVYEKGK